MGHRKKSAPRRGSLAFRPRARSEGPIARIRYWPDVTEPTLLGFAGYKAGMSYAYYVEDNQTSPNFGKEIFAPVTIIEAPVMNVLALRVYERTVNGHRVVTEAWSANIPKSLSRVLKPPVKVDTESRLKLVEENLGRASHVCVLTCTNPGKANVPQKKPEIMEVRVGGKTIQEQLEYAKKILGKEVDVSAVFKEGQFIDVVSVSKGKGIIGPVHRFGVRILQDKSRKTKRGPGCIGAWHPAMVMSTVPRAGQLGFAKRIEFNKKILKIGANGSEVTPKGGFNRYGIIRGQYVVVKGSIPGPSKRLIRMRFAAREPRKSTLPKVTIYTA